MNVIPTTQNAEICKIVVLSWPVQKVSISSNKLRLWHIGGIGRRIQVPGWPWAKTWNLTPLPKNELQVWLKW
jgi:hypothetical protein